MAPTNDGVYGRYNELATMEVLLWVLNQQSHHWGAINPAGYNAKHYIIIWLTSICKQKWLTRI